ncbi:hypothetical protein Y1Q_0003946 [Alligator mississippiensis]|uniref:Uncharacterized protein n=1 Tax=Alligator mississippiensis TaxID=8496 RepID=A0A151NQR9_ALLMI|nr:hypothetical protein Y1Q_0003946 [Alligator mississippiensis]
MRMASLFPKESLKENFTMDLYFLWFEMCPAKLLTQPMRTSLMTRSALYFSCNGVSGWTMTWTWPLLLVKATTVKQLIVRPVAPISHPASRLRY